MTDNTLSTAAALIAAIFAAVLAYEIFGTPDFQPQATLSDWGVTVTSEKPDNVGWNTKVIPATLWQPGNHWCSSEKESTFG